MQLILVPYTILDNVNMEVWMIYKKIIFHFLNLTNIAIIDNRKMYYYLPVFVKW